MTHRRYSPLFLALTVACVANAANAQGAPGGIAPQTNINPNAVTSVADVARSQTPETVTFTASAPAASASQTTGYSSSSLGGTVGARSHLGGRRGNVTVIIGNQYPVYAPPYHTYPAYPGYEYPYGYPGSSGASVTISTPGFQNQHYTLFPWSTTVTTWGNAPGYGPTYHRYPNYPAYPAYPTYVPNYGAQGYRGAAGHNYNYNGGSVLGGGYVPGTVGIPPLNFGSAIPRR